MRALISNSPLALIVLFPDTLQYALRHLCSSPKMIMIGESKKGRSKKITALRQAQKGYRSRTRANLYRLLQPWRH